MKKAEMAEFKKLLEHLQARLRGDVRQLAEGALGAHRGDEGGESKSPTHMAELGSDTFEQDFALSLVQNEQETLLEIAKALEKIKSGTFGQCEGCVKEGKAPSQSIIPKERLRVIPYAKYCVRCARVLEGTSP
jgi:DnaK suppressor protein